MAADNEFSLTTATVGQGGANSRPDVFMVQLLLHAAGVLPASGVDGRYKNGGETAKALLKFQEQWNDAVGEPFCIGAANKRDPLTLLQPQDEWLVRMAAAAQILVPMPIVSDYRGIDELHEWMVSQEIKYEPATEYGSTNSRSFWPIAGNPDLAIQLQTHGYNAAGAVAHMNRYIEPGPIQINCTTYANMMLAVYLFGTLDHPNYKPWVGEFGGNTNVHLSQNRYGFRLIKTPEGGTYFTSAEQILDVVNDWEIYSMEIGCDPNHGTGHYATLHNSIVYESYGPAGGGHSANDWGIIQYFRDRLSSYSRWVYLFGQP